MWHRTTTPVLVAMAVGVSIAALNGACLAQQDGAERIEAEYLVGGPLAGVRLDPFPTQHGEPSGHPGSLPDRAYRPQGQHPQLQLYEGAIEHFRTYWHKYAPVRSRTDAQSLVHNFIAAELPGMRAHAEVYAEPVYWVGRHGHGEDTGERHALVDVVRTTAEGPRYELDLGELDPGVYAVRVIGAVETEHLETFRRPLYVHMSVNDGLDGERTDHRQRIGYVDQFYSVAELYFHAPRQRRYELTLAVDEGSEVPLLVHNIDVHDMLAGAEQRALKDRMTLSTIGEREQLRRSMEDQNVRVPFRVRDRAEAFIERRAQASGDTGIDAVGDEQMRRWKDDFLWQSLPPINSQRGGVYGRARGYRPDIAFGAEGKTMDEIAEIHGEWTRPGGRFLPNQLDPVLLVNEKMGLEYTMRDLAAARPLPDPYPYKDDGASLYFTAADDDPDAVPQNFTLVADEVTHRYRTFGRALSDLAEHYHKTGDAQSGRDAAMLLVRLAYQYPALDDASALSMFLRIPADWNRCMRFRQRITRPRGFGDLEYLVAYDQIFDIIDGNQELAEAVGRFVPWVQTPGDVIKLIDVYLVQDVAKRLLRYHTFRSDQPLLTVVQVLGAHPITDPWMEWLFSRTFVYPQPISGLHDLSVTSHDRDGRRYIASYHYAMSQEASTLGEQLGHYVELGGNPEYDLRDPEHYPKVVESVYWPIRTRMAGLHWPRMGSVAGPDKPYGYQFGQLAPFARRGWQWTRDPDFAFLLKHFAGREAETDAEWAAIEAAAEGRRAPWLDNRSRIVPNWMGVLESGVEHDDFRFRRAVMLRIGQGWGHHHNDTLDLQLSAHGYPMTVDGGQRGGYSNPNDRHTRTHNLVEVDGQQWLGHSWVNTLTDGPSARYLAAEAEPPRNHPHVSLYQRQLALIDVDEGEGARPLEPEELHPDATLDHGVTSANSYVVDVVRVIGGRMHTYQFHGPVDDQWEVNLDERVRGDQLPEHERDHLRPFEALEQSFAGDAPDTVVATWRMTREDVLGSEQGIAPSIWNERTPRKYTRLHVLGQRGARILGAPHRSTRFDYTLNQLFIQHRHDEQADVVVPAIIEPYVGEPFIVARQLIDIPNNETDARRAVAIEVQTVNGHHDLIYMSGRAEPVRRVADHRIAGEYAFHSTDHRGLRLASLAGGTILETDDVRIEPEYRERIGQVIDVDYTSRHILVDSDEWPTGTLLDGRVFEVGVPGRMTSYTLTGAESVEQGTRLSVLRGADLYLSRVEGVDSDQNIVRAGLALPVQSGRPSPGMDKHWVASNEAGTRFWRADYLGQAQGNDGYAFQLDDSVHQEDFERGGGFRLWEYGVGDQVRQSTFVNLRRIDEQLYELTADVPMTLAIQTSGIEISHNRQQWQALPGQMKEELHQVRIELNRLDEHGQAYLRLH